MWQLFDLAYVVPACVALGYFIGKYLESSYQGGYMTASIMIGAVIGFVLFGFKIKKFIDSQNNKK